MPWAMTDLLERAMVAARDLPPEMQGDVTRLVLAYAGEEAMATPPTAEDAAADVSRPSHAAGE